MKTSILLSLALGLASLGLSVFLATSAWAAVREHRWIGPSSAGAGLAPAAMFLAIAVKFLLRAWRMRQDAGP